MQRPITPSEVAWWQSVISDERFQGVLGALRGLSRLSGGIQPTEHAQVYAAGYREARRQLLEEDFEQIINEGIGNSSQPDLFQQVKHRDEE